MIRAGRVHSTPPLVASLSPPLTPNQLAEHGGEPRIRDLVLAERLGFNEARAIRKLIDRNRAELAGYGEVRDAVSQTSEAGGRPGKEYWLNEGQALVLCALSRTPQAAAVRKQIVTVFMAYRAGKLVAPHAHEAAGANTSLDELRQDARSLAKAAAALLSRIDRQEKAMQVAAVVAAAKTLPSPIVARAPEAASTGALLHGIEAIGGHLGMTARQAKHRVATAGVPTFKLGRIVCSTPTMLDAWLARRTGALNGSSRP